MSAMEEYANYLDSESAIQLFSKIQKSFNGNKELASKECGISKKSAYDWDKRKEDLKHSTKVKILEKSMEEFPVELFQFITQNLYESGTRTLMIGLATIYEHVFDSKDESEFKQHVSKFEIMTEQYAGLIYKHKELEVNNMFVKLKKYAKDHNYNWKPNQTTLYDSNAPNIANSKIINSYS